MTTVLAAVLKLKYDFHFDELLTATGLQRLDQIFLNYLQDQDPILYKNLVYYRERPIEHKKTVSELIIAIAPILESFIADFYAIESALHALQEQDLSHEPVFRFKKHYVLRLAKRQLHQVADIESFQELDQWVTTQLLLHDLENIAKDDRELAIAQFGLQLLNNESETAIGITKLTRWCIAALTSEIGQKAVNGWEMFHLPARLDFTQLVPVVPLENDIYGRLQSATLRQREGFNLTDPRMSSRQAMNEVHYCVYCHENEGDFCSKGFPVKKGMPEWGFKMNPLGETLVGCPLEEKISEMHVLKKSGHPIAALAVTMIDNPMCPATGHRICNDCMKACIYQKQEPVNIPQTETRILTDVLHLPWGVEIYDLLTRWNPLRQTQWCLKPYNGLKVLIMGMGPAGFTLAHHLLMEGFAVVGADGLKIESLPERWRQAPIYAWQELQEQLSTRVMLGFGGVAEYGITVRWDKNFLKLIYLNLMRHHYFQVLGGVRFGGSLTVEDAWRLGFDHLSVAVGAGLPKEIAIPNSLSPGMRQANDFLMALQLSGAAKQSSLANLQVRMPAVIIGGGLTGVDTATEVQAYYIVQVEKVATRYQALVARLGEIELRQQFDELSLLILDEFLAHAASVSAERELAKREGRVPDLIQLIRRWGGVTIVYRHAMTQSPAYRRNPEELIKALEEGIYYAEGLEPTEVLLDEWGQTKGLACRWSVFDEEGQWRETDEQQVLPARAIFVATGARLNVAYEFEHRGTFVRKSAFEYQRYELIEQQLEAIEQNNHVKSAHIGPFTSYQDDQHYVSFLGDTHPIFHGSVVKAIASAKRIYPSITTLLKSRMSQGDFQEYKKFRQQLSYLFHANVIAVTSLAKEVVELVVCCPMAAVQFKVGQFYRVQNYERHAAWVEGTQLQSEGLALLAIPNPQHADYLNFIVLARGASSRLLTRMQVGEPIAVMGPTGVRHYFLETAHTVMVIGGAMAAIYVLSLHAARSQLNANLQIIFVACFDSEEEVFYRKELEAAATVIFVYSGRLWIDELLEYEQKTKTSCESPSVSTVQHIVLFGSSTFLQEFRVAACHRLRDILAPDVCVWGSVYGPMQCMLKGVCAQCLQWQIDPKTGKRTKAIYACSWQQQPLQKIDIEHLDQRLMQNQCLEILSDAWLKNILD